MKNLLILDIQKELEKFQYSNSLPIAKEIVDFTKGNKNKIAKILKRLKNAEPWEYIKGHTYFLNNKILTNKNVLIPRIETEELVKRMIEKAKGLKGNYQVFDIGTGSGCIAISVSKVLKKDIDIYAIDISKKALQVAQKNAQINKCKNIKFINTNLLDFDFNSKKNTIIVANLPYIPTSQIKTLEKSVRDFEPILALDGGSKGINYYEILIKQIKNKEINLKCAIFEIEPSTAKYFKQKGFKIFRDSFGKNRFVIILPTHLK